MKLSNLSFCLLLGFFTVSLVSGTALAESSNLARGKYLLEIGGCNDCHTPGFSENSGEVAETQWMTGTDIGFQGPWGTTYPANLRVLPELLTSEQWLTYVRRPMRPPMPWYALTAMQDDDLVAIYDYLKSLGAAGTAAPEYRAPGVKTTGLYYDFVPKTP